MSIESCQGRIQFLGTETWDPSHSSQAVSPLVRSTVGLPAKFSINQRVPELSVQVWTLISFPDSYCSASLVRKGLS